MRLKYLYIFGILFLVSSVTFADQFVPEFNQMKKIRCDIEEIIYNQDNSVVSKNKYFRIFTFKKPQWTEFHITRVIELIFICNK